MASDRIAFMGLGQMATALAQGFVGSNLVSADQVGGFDPDAEARRRFAGRFSGARIGGSHEEALAGATTVILAVKPQVVESVAEQVRPHVTEDRLLLSIVAGVSLSRLASLLGSRRVIRVMPNTPSLIGQGASAFAMGSGASAEDSDWVARLMGAVGLVERVEERLLDAVTGLSGSGPAYVYLIIEALADGGVRAGLPRDLASRLAAQMVRGAAQMVVEGNEHAAVLKDRVCSPGGTTIAGVEVLERRAVRGAMMGAVAASAARSIELGSD